MMKSEIVQFYRKDITFKQNSFFILTFRSQIRGRSSKIVSGSQFRHTSRESQLKCEQCDLYDRALKKNKETIRSLKFKLERFEEKYHDLKMIKSSASHQDNGNVATKQV